MKKSEILNELRKQKPVLEERFNITKIALIESESVMFCDDHINVMAWFDGYSGWMASTASVIYLEDIFGVQVDLVTEDGVRNGMHPDVHMELTYA